MMKRSATVYKLDQEKKKSCILGGEGGRGLRMNTDLGGKWDMRDCFIGVMLQLQ